MEVHYEIAESALFTAHKNSCLHVFSPSSAYFSPIVRKGTLRLASYVYLSPFVRAKGEAK